MSKADALAALQAINTKRNSKTNTNTLADSAKASRTTANRSAAQLNRIYRSAIEETIANVTQHFPHELRPYQVEGVEFMLTTWIKNSGILQGDDMGLGKTVQAITATLCKPEFKFTLYLTKPSLIQKTADEWNMWGKHWTDKGDLSVIPILPNNNKTQTALVVEYARKLPGQVIFITNYESLNSFPFLTDYDWDLLIVDEVHKLKGGAQYSPTKMWRNTKQLVWGKDLVDINSGKIDKETLNKAKRNEIKLKPQVKHYLFMSGTFIVNGSEELWSYLNIFNPWIFDDLYEFKNLLTYTAEGNMEPVKLLEILTPMMVRRRIDEVCNDLPELIEETVYVKHKPVQAAIYKQLRDEFLAELPDGGVFTTSMILDQMLRLRQINVSLDHIHTVKKVRDEDGNVIEQFPLTLNWDGNEKIDASLDLIESLSENKERVVIFSNFNQPIADLSGLLQDANIPFAVLTGSKQETGWWSPRAQRADTPINIDTRSQDKWTSLPVGDLVSLWQNTTFDKGPQVFLINLASGAEGLNLQKSDKWIGGASHCIMLDRWWNNARNSQAVARLYRMDTRAPVFVYWMETKDSIDDFMKEICEDKQTIADGIVESSEVRYSKDRIASLI